MPDKKFQFHASLAPKWLLLDREGEGKITLLASASELASVMSMSVLGEALLKVTVEVEDD